MTPNAEQPMRTSSRRTLSAAILGGATAAGLSLAFAMPAAASDALSDSTLSRVQQGQVLKVCTTGDYAPFSHREDNGDFEGIDIDMAASLARSLGATVQTVPTSWPTLMEDFTSGKCDIAMSGISVKLDRQAQAYFSKPYQTGGKTPIVRCEDVDKYQTVAQINQPSVRITVNPGGTNERFANEFLSDATRVAHNDNRTIFNNIIEDRADVMVTDAIETQLQASRHPELCSVHPDSPFTFSQKGYLLPLGDSIWKAYVDQWLTQMQGTGEQAAIFDKWING
ncbi:transporter substrate-binding domain-containing protein [Cobetia sp. 1CM21F]|uniref:transporter substrate-binding domain-containing protein n=1 Tax=Cobetia sp. 1CM21F TaxID=2929163 RepID=UPI0020BFDF29|nr:transporter substrate-binding domain-containing protein [Cobetia sp. 1CM21F]MCK8068144.1 transporter substrate-binding domain-containing protein [Cobetia sp. 1CM21F]